MIVTNEGFRDAIKQFSFAGTYGVDTETFGLHRQDRLYSIILSNDARSYYFNFLDEEDHNGVKPSTILPRSYIKEFKSVFENPKSIWYIHNAKFDMSKLGLEGLTIKGRVHCTLALARLEKNNHLSYTLDSCIKRIQGYDSRKLPLDEYISKHKLYTQIEIPGKLRKQKNKHYHKIPFDIMSDYGSLDGKLVYDLGTHQEKKLKEISTALVRTEIQLTKVCFKMEERGIKLDLPYVRKAKDYQEEELIKAKNEFFELTAIEYKRGPKCLVEAFQKMGESIPQTGKGNPCFSKDAIGDRDTPIVKILTRIRTHEKVIDTYYSSFLHLVDCRGVLRANIWQGGTETGRFSYSSPNLQNLPKEANKNKPFYVRKCLVPRQDHCLVMIDYDQQEYRLMLDYAGEKAIINMINNGLDVHEATAKMLNHPKVDRQIAKTINFMLLYGGGTAKLAKQLNIPETTARAWRSRYFDRLPYVQRFLERTIRTAKIKGHIHNWAGRRCYLSSHKGAYIMPNHLIQGGCADIIKSAMVKIDKLLVGTKSAMLIQVHDELILEMHKTELDLIPKIKAIMESIYQPKNNLKLTCGVEHSWVSLAPCDKVEGLPSA